MGIIAVCVVSLVVLASCDTVAVHRWGGHGAGYGPPAHAKAYGCRNKLVCGHELVFDDACGVYVVVGMTDWYYYDGCFYRLHCDIWEVSLRADVWEPTAYDRLPPGLRIKTRAVVAAGNGNGVVKLNGNGNSLVKLNGNPHNQGNGKSGGRGRK